MIISKYFLNQVGVTLIRRLLIFASVVIFLLASSAPYVQAQEELSPEQIKLYNKNIFYFEDKACGADGQTSPSAASGPVTAGTGEPTGTTFPSLSPDAMAQAIDKYIEDTNPSSKLSGLGSTIVASSKNSNISPFLIVAIAQKESGLANPSDFNVRNGNNAFGRTATTSQPNFQGARLWYKWTSVKASVDHTATENKNATGGGDVPSYIRKQYASNIDAGDMRGFFNKYAPAFENDTAKYITDVGKGIEKMASLAEASAGGSGAPPTAPAEPAETSPAAPTEPAASTPGLCQCVDITGGTSGGGSGGSVSVEKNAKTIFDFFVGEGYTSEQAAGFIGNFYAESELDPGKKQEGGGNGYGLAQWDDRRDELEAYAQQKSKPVDDIMLQLDFAKFELDGTEGAAKSAIKAVTGSGIPTVENVTEVIMLKYERPGVQRLSERIEKALEYYEKFKDSSSAVEAASNATVSSGSGCGGGASGGGSGTGVASGTFAWPIEKAVGPVTSCYGMRRSPTSGNMALHTGLDIAAAAGTKIGASDGGKVVLARNTDPGGFGKAVIIEHENGKWTLYGHMRVVTVAKDDKVDQGQKIGEVNNTGSSAGDHLHFNIQTAAAEGEGSVDPLDFLPKDGRAVSGSNCPASL